MKQKDILILVIPLFLLALIFIVLNIYHNSVTSTISEAQNIQIIPIPPDFDQKTILSIKKRDKITPLYELAPATVTQNPVATGSAKIQ